MNMFDKAKSISYMMEMKGMTQSELAKILDVSQSYIANKLRLLSLTPEMQNKVVSSGLTERHVRALLRLGNENLRTTALNRICEDKLNVAQTEALIDFLHNSDAPTRIGRADKLSRVDSFLDTLRESTEMLSSLGIEVNRSIHYSGKRIYINICIREDI